MFRRIITVDTTRKLFQTSRSLILLNYGRSQYTASMEAKPERISKNLSFRSAYDSPIDQEFRPLVLLYGWLVAKSKHIHKYGDFYLKHGYDVLHIKIDPMQLMWPKNAQRVIQQVVDFTQQDIRTAQPILVHGFSVGAYLYGETLVKIVSDASLIENIQPRLRGQIYDSPVDFTGIPLGVSKAVTTVPLLQKSIHATISSYMKITKNQTVKHYLKSSETFKENQMKAPTMFLYSKADPIGTSGAIEEIIGDWKSKNFSVYSKCWPDSQHVGHFHSYPVEYIGSLNYFLQQIGLLKEPLQDKIEVVA